MEEALQLIQALVVHLLVMAGLTITFPFWICPFIRRLRVPFEPQTVID